MTARRDELLGMLEQEFGVMIRRARRVIGERARSVHPDLQPSSYLMLGHVRAHGPLRASTMSAVFDLDKGAVSRQVQHLLDLGFIEGTPDPADGRATLLSISDEGARRLDEVREQRRKWLDDKLDDWDEAALGDFTGMLIRYNNAMGR